MTDLTPLLELAQRQLEEIDRTIAYVGERRTEARNEFVKIDARYIALLKNRTAVADALGSLEHKSAEVPC